MNTILEYTTAQYTDEEKQIIAKTAKAYHLYDFIAAIICQRNQFNLQEISEYICGTQNPKHFKALKDIQKAVHLIHAAINQNEKIRIIGDYDVDGITSTYVLLSVFEALGYKNVSHYLPLREKDGYGLNLDIVDAAYHDEIKLLITVDNGISATDAVLHAKTLGMTVIITDHHELPTILPQADAIINPHQPDCHYPYKTLCGAGVAYKLGQALMYHFKIKPPLHIINRIQALVAMGTVCDVVPLIGENRHLVKTGLIALNKGALPAACTISSRISIGSLGFQIGPRLNACGRLESAETALNYLKCEQPDTLLSLKQHLDNLNRQRQEEEMDSVKRMMEKVDSLKPLPDVIVLIDEQAHESVVGLVAGKIKEKYYRPTVIFSKTIQGFYKGSGRSIEEYDMFGNFKPFLNLIDGGGGHPMACGLKASSIGQIEAFSKAVNVSCHLSEYDKIPKIYVDKLIENAQDFDWIELEKQLSLFLPCGAGNSAPTLLVKNTDVHIETKYAKHYRISKIIAAFGSKSIEGTLWDNPTIPEEGHFKADIILQVTENGWQIRNLYFN